MNTGKKQIKVCLQADGTSKTGMNIIDYLQSLGGVNIYQYTGFSGDPRCKFYAIDKYNQIQNYVSIPHGFTLIDVPQIKEYELLVDIQGWGIEKGKRFRKTYPDYRPVSYLGDRELPKEIVEHTPHLFKAIYADPQPVKNIQSLTNIDSTDIAIEVLSNIPTEMHLKFAEGLINKYYEVLEIQPVYALISLRYTVAKKAAILEIKSLLAMIHSSHSQECTTFFLIPNKGFSYENAILFLNHVEEIITNYGK